MRAAALMVAALPAMAAAEEGKRDALYTALAQNRCEVTEDETPRVFGSHGFDPEYVRHELGQMVLDETAFLEGGRVLRVKAQYCPPADPAPTPAQSFRQAVVDNGCSIDADEVRAMGVDAAAMRPAILTWIDDGSASVEWDRLTLRDCE